MSATGFAECEPHAERNEAVVARYLRGTRVGSSSSPESDRGIVAIAQAVPYWCNQGHQSFPRFAEEALAPEAWDCSTCGQPAGRTPDGPPPPAAPTRKTKSPLDHLHERRNPADGDRIVAEALAQLRGKA
jgi:hypothetical protein